MFILQALLRGLHGRGRGSERLKLAQAKLPVTESRYRRFKDQPLPVSRHRLTFCPLMRNGMAVLIFKARIAADNAAVIKFPVQVILDIQIRYRSEEHTSEL